MNNTPIPIEIISNIDHYILALDISTANIGVTIFRTKDNVSELIKIETIRLNKLTKSKSLYKKADLFLKYLNNDLKGYSFDYIFVEEPLMGSINPSTAGILFGFNTLICYLLLKKYDVEPIMLDLNTIRKQFCPELVTKKHHRDGSITETLSFPDEYKNKKKEYIWKKVSLLEQQIEWDTNKTGNIADYCYDMSDSYALGIAGINIIYNKNN